MNLIPCFVPDTPAQMTSAALGGLLSVVCLVSNGWIFWRAYRRLDGRVPSDRDQILLASGFGVLLGVVGIVVVGSYFYWRFSCVP